MRQTRSAQFSGFQKMFIVSLIAVAVVSGAYYIYTNASSIFDVTLQTNPNLEEGLTAHYTFDGDTLGTVGDTYTLFSARAGGGLVATTSSEVLQLSYEGAQESIFSLVYDSTEGVLYAGQGSGGGDSDIYYCKPSAGDADGLCGTGEWTLAYDGALYAIYSLVYDSTEGVLYAGQGSGGGDSDIYYCKPSAGDADGLCETGEWTLAYDGGQESILSLVYDSTEGVLYAGLSSDTGDGDIYYCKPSAGDADGLCETGEWTLAYDGAQERILSLVYDSTEGVLYAGQGSGLGDGDIYYCKPSAGDADGLCETGEWTLAYDGAQERILSLVYDSTEGVLYAGQGDGGGDGDIYYCKPSAGDADGLCETGEWALAYSGAQESIYSLVYDSTEGVLYAGQGSSGGDGDIYYCKPSAGDADGLCETGEWTLAYDGAQESIYSLVYDSTEGVLYAGQGSGGGDGDILSLHKTPSEQAPGAIGQALSTVLPGALGNTTHVEAGAGSTIIGSFAFWAYPYNARFLDLQARLGSWHVSFGNSASSFGVNPSLHRQLTISTVETQEVYAFVYDSTEGVLYAGQGYTAAGDGDIYYCKPSAGDADGLCETGEWTLAYDGAQETIYSLVYDSTEGVLYAGQGYTAAGDGDIYYCKPSAGDADGLCETGEWTLAYGGGQESILSLVYDSTEGVLYAGQGYTAAGDGDIYYCKPSAGDSDGLCETGEWTLAYGGAQESIYSLVYDSTEGVLYAGQGSGLGDGDIYYCKPSAGDADGLCETGEWTLAYDGALYAIYSLVYDSTEGVLYAGQSGNLGGDGDIYYCKPSAGDADGLCETGEWTLAYGGAQETIYSLVYDSTEGVLYAGQGDNWDDGDIYYCKPSAGDADGLCETGEWSALLAGTQRTTGTQGLWADPVGTYVYASKAVILPATLYVDGQAGGTVSAYNEWHHVAIEYTSEAVSSELLEIVAPETGLDDLRMYDHALGAENISRLYGLGATTRIGKTLATNPALEQGLTHHWTFDATGATSTFADRIGGLTGTTVATTTYVYSATTSSPTSVSTVSSGTGCNSSASLAWSTPTNATSQNDTYTTVSHTTFDSGTRAQCLYAYGYGFSLPSRSTIDGITVEMDRYTSVATVKDYAVNLYTTVREYAVNKGATTTNWATSDTDTYTSFGDSTDTWGQSLTETDVDDSSFGVIMSTESTGSNAAAHVDHIRMTLDYTTITYEKYPTPVPGAIGQGFQTHGEGDHLEFGDAGSGVKTLAFWVKFPGSRASQKILNLDGTDQVETNSSGVIVATSFPGATVYVDGSSASAAITDTDWHHVVITDSTGVSASTFEAGRVGIPNYGTFSIDDLRTYDRVLSQSDIDRLYGLGNTTRIGKTLANPALDSGLVGHWSFDGKDMDLSQVTAEVRDRSGQGFHGDWRNHATTTQPGALGQAIYFDGVDDYVYIGDAYNGVKSVGLWFYTNATGTQLIEFNATQAIEIGESTVTTHSITSPTVYVDGVVNGTFGVNGWHHVLVTTDTGIDANVVQIPEPGDGAGTADTGWVTAGTGSSVSFTGADFPWSNPTRVTADDASYTNTSEDLPPGDESYYLRADNFGLSVPAGATINGVEARFEGYETNTTDNQLINNIKLVNASGAVTTTNKATSAELATTPTLYAFGGASDVWGETLTSTYVNDTDFGFVLSTLTGASGNAKPYVDYMQVKVTYTEASSKFSGAFDDFRMYNRALSAAEARRLYEMGK